MLLDPTGIEEEQEILANTFVYPNPANAEISWKSDISVTDVRIYNSVGQLFQTANAMVGEVDVNNIADGLYFVQFFNTNEHVKTSKVLIQH
ncbi:T9SS type A sorting domain-containing protein [Vicingaceae bacterium]|nr:T9SS type A sorting domain-containing protein [Vicingaceae bacterium]